MAFADRYLVLAGKSVTTEEKPKSRPFLAIFSLEKELCLKHEYNIPEDFSPSSKQVTSICPLPNPRTIKPSFSVKEAEEHSFFLLGLHQDMALIAIQNKIIIEPTIKVSTWPSQTSSTSVSAVVKSSSITTLKKDANSLPESSKIHKSPSEAPPKTPPPFHELKNLDKSATKPQSSSNSKPVILDERKPASPPSSPDFVEVLKILPTLHSSDINHILVGRGLDWESSAQKREDQVSQTLSIFSCCSDDKFIRYLSL